MQTVEQTKATGLAKFSSLVYLYTALGIGFWLISALFFAKNFDMIMPLMSWTNQHPLLGGAAFLVISMGLLTLCRAFVNKSYFLTFAFYLVFLAFFSLVGVEIFQFYSVGVIAQALVTTSVIFIVMAGYGYFTKTNLMSWSKTLFIGLIAILIVSVLNALLFKSGIGQTIIDIVTIVIFMGYIAFDSQNLKVIYEMNYEENGGANLGAIALYASIDLILDFINILLNLIRILGIFGDSDN